MGRFMRSVVLALGLLATFGAPVPALEQRFIDRAIEQGVAALRRAQAPNGKWNYTEVGATALAGLALLECDAKAGDPAVRAAAAAVRQASPSLGHTYSIALAILFLERLEDPGDQTIIEVLGLRLMAGQAP